MEIGSDLSFLVYLGRAKPNNVPKGRVVRLKFKEPIFLLTFGMVSVIFGFRLFLFSEFFWVIGLVASFLSL